MITQYPITNTNTPTIHPPPSLFALGDSYTAGIGASCGWTIDEFDTTGSCLRCNGSYAHQIANLTATHTNTKPEVYNLACTGALINDILYPDPNNRTSQINLMKSKRGLGEWATLTIGGNDVGFGSIVANCIAYNTASCEADLNSTEAAIADPIFMEKLAETYLAVLGAAKSPKFKLIVPGYAQFFNAETKECDGQFLWFGRYLTQTFRARVNQMVANLNVIIQVAVAVVQMQLVFSNSRKGIWYEDWDGMFEGHRFCEVKPKGWVDAWFFTIKGADTLPNGTTMMGENGPETLGSSKCSGDLTMSEEEQEICERSLEEKTEDGNLKIEAYPWWAQKTMHPKSIAHFGMGRKIYEKWMDGEYF